MGAVSRSALERLFIGSTAEAVSDKLSCDVLIVKPAGFAASMEGVDCCCWREGSGDTVKHSSPEAVQLRVVELLLTFRPVRAVMPSSCSTYVAGSRSARILLLHVTPAATGGSNRREATWRGMSCRTCERQTSRFASG